MAEMSQKPKKYLGALAKPIDVRGPEILSRPELPDEHAAIRAEIQDRFALLLKHYEIDLFLPLEQVSWSLAVCLAFDHVPGFQIRAGKPKGAKRRWTLDECRALVSAVDAKKTNKGVKVAIGMAMRRKDWKWGTNVKSIEVRYHEAMRQIKFDEQFPPYSFKKLMAAGEMYRPRRKRTTKRPS
jgi:hypothetical protein